MKSDVVLGLVNAAWPVFVVNESGTIHSANPAASHVLGASLSGSAASLSSIWLAENDVPSAEFLAHWERAPVAMTQVRLLGQGGAHLAFQACICSILDGGQKYFVFQLLPQPPAVADSKAAAVDAGLAHKQKLDCALQLARTVSLDFNNALTSILGHTSLVLSKIEPGNPGAVLWWRWKNRRPRPPRSPMISPHSAVRKKNPKSRCRAI